MRLTTKTRCIVIALASVVFELPSSNAFAHVRVPVPTASTPSHNNRVGFGLVNLAPPQATSPDPDENQPEANPEQDQPDQATSPEPDQDQRETDQDQREPDQAQREPDQDQRETDQDQREPDQDQHEADQDQREPGQATSPKPEHKAAPPAPSTPLNTSTPPGSSVNEPNPSTPPPTSADESTASTSEPASKEPQKRRLSIPPFWFDRETATHRTRAMGLPPLFFHRSAKPGHPETFFHANLALSFAWYSKRTEKRYLVSPWAAGSFSERKTVWGALPLMGYRRIGDQYNFAQFPFVWRWGTKYTHNLFIFPVHYQKREPEGFSGVSGLLVWYGHRNLDDAAVDNDKRHLVIAPLFYRFQRGLIDFDFAFLYFRGQNKLKGRRFGAVLPFGVWGSSEFGNRRELWSLAWIRRTDQARQTSSWAVPPLLTFRTEHPKRSLLSITPLVWHRENRITGHKVTIAGPVGVVRDDHQRNTFVAPLYYRFKDTDANATTQILAPLFVTRRSEDKTAVWTLLGGGRKSTHGWAFGLPWALSFASRNDDGRRLGAIAGIFWHAHRPAHDDTPATSRWVFGPLGYADRVGDRRRLGLLPVLSFARWGTPRRYQVVTPLFWHVRDDERDQQTVVAGPVFSHRVGEARHGGIAPLAFWGQHHNRRYIAIPPLLSGHVLSPDGTQATTFSPLFVISRSPEQRTIGAAWLAWDIKRGDTERHSGLFPLYYRRQLGESTLTLTPLGGRLSTPEARTIVTLLYGRRRTEATDQWGVFPFVFHGSHDHGQTRRTTIPPLFFHQRSPQIDITMATPLVWRTVVRGPNGRKNFAAIPFYFRQRQPDGVDVDAGLWGLPVFYARNQTRHTHTVIAGPMFHRLSRKALHTGVAPIYWWKDSQTDRRLISLPVIVHIEDKTKDEHTTIAIPFWFDRQRADGRRGWSLFPFMFGGRRGDNFLRVSLAPPGFVDIFRLHRNVRFTGFPFAFRYQKCGFQEQDEPSCRYTLWNMGVVFWGRNGQGRVTHGIAPLYAFNRDESGRQLYTPLFGINNQPGKVLGWYATPLVGVRTTNTHRRVFALPFYFRKAHRLEQESTTLVLPPLYIGRRRNDRVFHSSALLFWQFRQQHKVTTAVLPPIFLLSHTFAERKLLWVFPLFIRDLNIADDETWNAVPVLFTQRRHGTNLDFVQFPLIWHIERGENQGTMGAFVWWDIRRNGNTFQTVPALYHRRQTPEKDTHVIGPGLGWWSNGRGIHQGDFGWRALFGLFGAGFENQRKYIALLGRKYDRGPMSDADREKITRRQTKLKQRAERRAERRMKRRVRWQPNRSDTEG